VRIPIFRRTWILTEVSRAVEWQSGGPRCRNVLESLRSGRAQAGASTIADWRAGKCHPKIAGHLGKLGGVPPSAFVPACSAP